MLFCSLQLIVFSNLLLMITSTNAFFSKKLMSWNSKENNRKMPWKGVKDPYKIWLSEIILQQTRVEQGLSYYQNFVKEFPTIHYLAKAKPEKVYKMWEGLGYYSRCRNLIVTANIVSKELGGLFPNNYNEILKLKGICTYTASAIASFAFNMPYAVVDGNVYRVLARYFGIKKDTSTNDGKKYFAELAFSLLDKKNAGLYNQAIMDFGATVCKPALPLCILCPFKKNCQALLHNNINELPVKGKKIIIKKRWFNYFVITDGKNTLIKERTQKDIWQNLNEFYLIETKKQTPLIDLLKHDLIKSVTDRKYQLKGNPIQQKQKLSHQEINTTFIVIQVSKLPEIIDYKKVAIKDLNNYAFPRSIVTFLQGHKLAH